MHKIISTDIEKNQRNLESGHPIHNKFKKLTNIKHTYTSIFYFDNIPNLREGLKRLYYNYFFLNNQINTKIARKKLLNDIIY